MKLHGRAKSARAVALAPNSAPSADTVAAPLDTDRIVALAVPLSSSVTFRGSTRPRLVESWTFAPRAAGEDDMLERTTRSTSEPGSSLETHLDSAVEGLARGIEPHGRVDHRNRLQRQHGLAGRRDLHRAKEPRDGPWPVCSRRGLGGTSGGHGVGGDGVTAGLSRIELSFGRLDHRPAR
jgi:hypothetical protein